MGQNHRKINSRRWQLLRLKAFTRDGWRCTECGAAGRMEAHHITPLENGGAAYDLANIRTLCRGCHIERHRQISPERAAWREYVRELI